MVSRWYTVVLFISLLALSLAPSVAQSRQATPAAADHSAVRTDRILRIPGAGFPANLDPHKNSWNEEIAVSYLDFEGLTRLDEDSNTVPAAAESWELGDDGTTVTFTLREGLTYSDGSPLTAERFRYAVERSCDPHTAAPYAAVLFMIVGCEDLATLDPAALAGSPGATPTADSLAAYETARANLGARAIDDRTLEIRLTQPAAYFPTIAYTWVLYPVKQESVEADPDGWAQDPALRVGNGPFQLSAISHDQPHERISFIANEHYWAGRARLDGIEYVYGFDSAQEHYEAYRNGEIDMIWPDLEDIPAFAADPAMAGHLLSYSLASTTSLAFNLNQEPFQDKKVRDAFAYAFDRDGYCQEIAGGTCAPTLSWIPPGLPGAIATDAYAFDPAKARQALAASSYGDASNLPPITWVYIADNAYARIDAEWLAENFHENLGVDLILTPLPEDAYQALLQSPATWPQLTFFGWTQDYPDPQNWMTLQWVCDSAIYASFAGYCNPDLDALIAEADAEPDPERRLELYQQAGETLVADMPVTFLYNWTTAVLVKPDVTGYVTTPRDLWPGWASLLTLDFAPPA